MSVTNPPKDMNTSKSLDLILDRLQARDFYDAIQAVEKLGASEDFTAAVTVIGKYLKLYGYHVTTRKEAKQAIVEAVEGIYGDSDGLREFAGLSSIKSLHVVPSKPVKLGKKYKYAEGEQLL